LWLRDWCNKKLGLVDQEREEVVEAPMMIEETPCFDFGDLKHK
jgi:hypothetical protein